jgi:glycosyltransferase involved in cell wall biosynthesis
MPPVFSVIIPTRGRVAMLERAIGSVLAQTDPDFDIVVVDDGSPAREAAAIAELVGLTPRARVLRNPENIGAPASRNRAIAASTGSIIATLDSDDWWAPDRLARHRAAQADSATVLSYNPTVMVGLEGGRDRLICNARPPIETRYDLSLALWNFLGGCSSVCIDRRMFVRVGGFAEDLPSCQDWDLWYRIARDGGLVAFVPDTFTYQDWGQHERISTTRPKVEAGHERMFTSIASEVWSAGERRLIAAHHERVRARIENDFGDGLRAVFRSVRSFFLRPSRWAVQDMISYGRGYLRSLLGTP